MKPLSHGAVAGLFFAMATPAAATAPSAPPPGFISLFDGKTLSGWKGDPTVWSVQDSAITGGSDKPPPGGGSFLIYDRPYSNFELHYKYRLQGNGNSGFQFRSYVADQAKFSVKGYQANVVPTNQAERFGMLWDGGGRSELALLGQRMVITRKDGKVVKKVPASVNPRELLIHNIRPYPQWNDVVVIAYGNHIVHAINGYLVFDATDKDPGARKSGIFALQYEGGPPKWLQFKDIFVKPLKNPPKITGRFITHPGPPTPAEPGPRVRQ